MPNTNLGQDINLLNNSAGNGPAMLQSPYLKLMAAGSDGSDSGKGIHLRWALDGFLGKNHLPKGEGASAPNFFNKQKDYVFLFRAPYVPHDRTQFRLNLFSLVPDLVHPAERVWTYKTVHGIFLLHFSDASRYDAAVAAADPFAAHHEVIAAYGNGVFELTFANELSFAVNIGLGVDSVMRLETWSAGRLSATVFDTLKISSRMTIQNASDNPVSARAAAGRAVAENILQLRFSIDSGTLAWIGFETYRHFFADAQERHAFTPVGHFALTTDTNEAFRRLEDPARFQVNGSWAKFNDAARVNVANYQDRWAAPQGIRAGVAQYLQLSDSDPAAKKIFDDSSGDGSIGGSLELPLLDFLNIASLDYHVARMLGLGYIDTPAATDSDRFIYVAGYVTEKDPKNFGVAPTARHFYCSLPTSMQDQRPPLPLALDPLSYGLTVTNGAGGLLITDPNGYALYDPLRYVKLKARLDVDYSRSNGFFHPNTEFRSSEFSTPVFIGIENKKQPDEKWRTPELSHHPAYLDTNGISETQPVYFNKADDKPTYIHEVDTEGIDVYAAYPVSIFSRAGTLSQPQSTDYTKFRKPNTLKPPVRVATQLVQQENPLLLTSANEQQWLQHIGDTKTDILCRLSFDYTHTHDVNYGYGNRIQIFHKKNPPASVIGSIASIEDQGDSVPVCKLATTDFTYSNGQTFTPTIPEAEKHKFKGAVFSYRSINYVVEEVVASGPCPVLLIRKNETREGGIVEDESGNKVTQLQQLFQVPEINKDEGFVLVENLSSAPAWKEASDNKLGFEIDIAQSGWPEHVESYKDDAEISRTERVKGLWGSATVTQDGNTSRYTIQFDSVKLGHHPQFIAPDNAAGTSSVNWYRGIVRIHVQGDPDGKRQRKELKVESIVGVGTDTPITLIAVDSQVSGEAQKNVITGTGVSVNFHPGYRAYLRSDPAAEFEQKFILPGAGEGGRSTYIGLRTIDTTTLDADGKPYASPMSVPSVLLARELLVPLAPQKPVGPSFANPPDTYGKSSFTMEVEFAHAPWAIVFYRADIHYLLSCLYAPSTVDAICAWMLPLRGDENLEERWADLLSFGYQANGGGFRSFPRVAGGTEFRFPNPDRPDRFAAPYAKPEEVKEKIKDAVLSNLLPLTEQPLLFQYIKSSPYLPHPGKQVIADRYGKMLSPGDASFDQSPMAMKTGDKKIRFTDFTLDGDMHSDTAYMYVAREMSNSLQIGPCSPFLGPVQLCNTRPPSRPVVKKVTAETATAFNGYKSAIRFEVNRIGAQEGVSSVRIYRTETAADSLSPRTMRVVKEYPVPEGTAATFVISDDFSADPEIPFGVPLYYRIVGVRSVRYTDYANKQQAIDIASEPSPTLLSNMMEVIKPEAPRAAVPSFVSKNGKITQFTVTWNKTCYNGRYTVWLLNESNAWKPVGTVQSNDPAQLKLVCACSLPVLGERQEKLVYKVKVTVENSSGLRSREEVVAAFS